MLLSVGGSHWLDTSSSSHGYVARFSRCVRRTGRLVRPTSFQHLIPSHTPVFSYPVIPLQGNFSRLGAMGTIMNIRLIRSLQRVQVGAQSILFRALLQRSSPPMSLLHAILDWEDFSLHGQMRPPFIQRLLFTALVLDGVQ